MDIALHVDKLYKVYGKDKEEVTALDHITVDFPDNTICGLLGSNGAGKTTLIKCAVGLLEPTDGRILRGEEDITKNASERLKHVSVVLDGGRNLFGYMTVKENIRYFSLLRGKNIKNDQPYIQDILNYMGIEDIYNRCIQSLSFGMRQRASIAVALACRSDIIFMDEPTTGLDINYQDELAQLILKLKEKYRCTIIPSSHNMQFIDNVCSDCILIDKGKLIHSGKINEFKYSFALDNYLITCRQSLTNEQLARLQDRIKIKEYDHEKKALEVLWQNSENFCDLITMLQKEEIDVYSVEKIGGLAAAVANMTKGQEE